MSNLKSTITVLTCNEKGKKATKKFIKLDNGTIKKILFSAGKFFTHEEVPVSNLESLGKVLDSLSTQPRKFIIRGRIKENMDGVVRRKYHEPDAAFDACPRPYVMLDIDKLTCPEFFDIVNNPEQVLDWVQKSLPKPFRGVSCYYKFSSSQNVPYKGNQGKNKVSIHIWYYCDRVVADEEWKRYFKSISSPVDLALFSPVQPHYTTNPIFENMPDPIPNRSGIFKGKSDVVKVPKTPEPKVRKNASRSEVEPIINEDNIKKALDLLLPYYVQGSRNRFCAALAATLYRAGYKAENVALIIYRLAETASDEEIDSRCKNAISICESIDNNLRAPGIPTLREEFRVNQMDEILYCLGIGDKKINEAISKLAVSCGDEEIKEVISMFVHLPKKQKERYMSHITRLTKKKKADIKALVEDVEFDGQSLSGVDIPENILNSFLSYKYAGGHHLIRSSDDRYYRYKSTHWECISDTLIKKQLKDCVGDYLAELEMGGVSSTLNACLDLLECEAFRECDPFRPNNQEVRPIINCLNGEIWFDEVGDITLKPHRPENYLRSCLNVQYDPEARSPMFDKAVLEIFSNSSDPQDMFRHFMELAGYICQPWRKLAIIVLLYGGGSNGKTKLLGIIRNTMGEKTIMSGRLGDIEKSNFKIGDLEGKLMVLDDDVDGGTCLPDGFLKKISEEKALTGEHKFKQPFEFICRAVPVMLANDYPATRDLSYGLRRRLIVIPFKRTFEPNEIVADIFEKIWEQEASGILNHIIHGFGQLRKRGRFQEPEDCINAKNDWIVRSNILTTFIDEECEKGEGLRVHVGEFYKAFHEYCLQSGVKNILSKRGFAPKLKDLGYKVSLLDGKDAVWGLRLSLPSFEPHNTTAKPNL